MKKQTAVEWFFQQLTTVDYNCINKTFLQNDNSLEGHNMRKLFNHAKEMEKEQIIDAVNDAWNMEKHSNFVNAQAKQYYNETYNKEEK
jgi:hypothetical protein